MRIPLLRFCVVLVTVVSGGTLIAWAQKSNPQTPPAETAIRQVLDAQVAAWNRGDLEGFMAGYWNDERLSFYSGKDRTAGWKTTLERYQKRYQGEGKEMGKLAFVGTEIRLLGEQHALARSTWELTLTKEKVGGLFTLVLEKTANGWKIIHDHTSG